MTAATLAIHRPALPETVQPQDTTLDLLRLFGLDRLRQSRRPLACHWRRDAEGRLACHWEAKAAPVPALDR